MTILVIGALFVVCGAAMARLLWLIEGKPPLERPRWMRHNRT